MKKTVFSLMILLTVSVQCFSQLSIEECHKKARANYPLINQYDLIEKAEQYTLTNIAKNYLPQFSLNAQASYQSDVTKIPIDFASLGLPVDIEELDKDQYKAVLNFDQLIWDGGNTGSQKKITRALSDVEKNKVDVTLYEIEDRVTQLFFGILAIGEKMRVLDLKQEDLYSNKQTIESMFSNGRAMQSDLDQIIVELLNIEQSRTELQWAKGAYCRMMALFIHQEVTENTKLQIPSDSYSLSNNISRPELSMFDSQTSLYNSRYSAVTAKNMPRLSLFAQGGYGRPGLNMLDNNFDFFAVGGVKLTWNFGNLYTMINEKRLLEIDKSNISLQRETFLFNTGLELTQEASEIEKSKTLLTKDDEIINLRNRVKKASESKYKNGTYQTNELIRDINAEEQARQSKALHEIQYLFNIYNYRHTIGQSSIINK